VVLTQWLVASEASTAANEVPLRIQLLGPPRVLRDGEAVALPGSRKVKALLAYLALARAPVSRSQLCQLLWERPSDPRGELRWCLSKLRAIVDDPDGRRIQTRGDTIAFDSANCDVDAIEIGRMSEAALDALGPRERQRAAMQFGGDFLEGLEIGHSPPFEHWLTAQRRRFRALHARLLRNLASALPDEEAFAYLERWLEIAPFDGDVHKMLLGALTRRHRIREAKEHVEATTRLFEAEGLDCRPIRDAWRSARLRGSALRQPMQLTA